MNAPFPAPDNPGTRKEPETDPPNPVTEATQPTPQDAQDQGMYEAGIPGAVERRLIHVDRVTEETLVLVRSSAQTQLGLIAMIAIVGVMTWLLAREVRTLMEAYAGDE
jgi:hypothetical protein